MASRYINRRTAVNKSDFYKNYMKDRGRENIKQYRTANLRPLTSRQISNLTIVGHIWTMGDRYWKLSNSYYGDPDYWWVIAFYNNAPTEGHLELGDTIEIPSPLEVVLRYLKV